MDFKDPLYFRHWGKSPAILILARKYSGYSAIPAWDAGQIRRERIWTRSGA